MATFTEAGQSNVERLSELLSSMQPSNSRGAAGSQKYSQDAISYLKQKHNVIHLKMLKLVQ